MVSVPPADYQFHDTYFVVAHFHYTLIGSVIFGSFAAAYYWWPKIFGRLLNERLGKWHFWLFLIGFHMTFFVLHFAGLMGMPRRYFTYLEGYNLAAINLVSTIGSWIIAASVLIFITNVIYTSVRGPKAKADPWDGRTLEWAVPTPIPF